MLRGRLLALPAAALAKILPEVGNEITEAVVEGPEEP
jgi:hypothetical protein